MIDKKKFPKAKSCITFNWSTKVNLQNKQNNKSKKYKQINQYLILKKLGEGSYSKVYLGQNQNTHEFYALKRIELNSLSKTNNGFDQIENEIKIMRKLDHPNIISLHEVIHSPSEDAIYFVTEYANCGSLSQIINSGYDFDPKQIQKIFAQIVSGISFIHKNSIVHQDIKPANLLLKSNGKVLITDFGIGNSFENAAKVFGTPAYQAPEIISDPKDNLEKEYRSNYNPAQEDIWSLGVTLYELSFKKLPFDGQDIFDIANSISQINLLEPPSSCDPILWDIINKILTVDPKKRITIQEIMKHPYFLNSFDNQSSIFDEKISLFHENNDISMKKVIITHIKGDVVNENIEYIKSQFKMHLENKNSLYGR